MTRGSSIRIYLADSTVTGIRHAEVINWTGQAIACPRSRIAELAVWPESTRPGVYFLNGYNDETGKQQTYIGEAENVFERVQNHLRGKDYWNELIFFTNKDENLTKAHVKFLESKLLEIAFEAKRYEIINGVQPQAASLPRGDRDSMEHFIDHIKILLGVLGHKTLEKITRVDTISTHANSRNFELFLKAKGIEAKSILSDEGIVVLKGSKVTKIVKNSLSFSYKQLRMRLIDEKVILEDGDHMLFMQDYLFSSPSSAAAIVVGYAINGKESWKDVNGRTLSQLELMKYGSE